MPPSLDLLALLSLVAPHQAPGARAPGPAPLGTLVRPDEVRRHRSLACPGYDDCLDGAYRRGWRSWTCQHCPLFDLAADFQAIEARSVGAGRVPALV